MKHLSLILVLFVLVSACAKKDQSAPSSLILEAPAAVSSFSLPVTARETSQSASTDGLVIEGATKTVQAVAAPSAPARCFQLAAGGFPSFVMASAATSNIFQIQYGRLCQYQSVGAIYSADPNSVLNFVNESAGNNAFYAANFGIPFLGTVVANFEDTATYQRTDIYSVTSNNHTYRITWNADKAGGGAQWSVADLWLAYPVTAVAVLDSGVMADGTRYVHVRGIDDGSYTYHWNPRTDAGRDWQVN